VISACFVCCVCDSCSL